MVRGSTSAIERDKNSLWNESNILKRELYVKKKDSEEKFTRYGGLSQAVMGKPGQRAFGVG
jgi:hypothetical protein